jgi:NADPH-dependent 2,4-dienoyl-CoA reductase/sulfur reductase-like enzyme
VKLDIRSVVIVGAGQAGGRAAKAMRDAGFSGRITLVGAEPHLPYERPPLSKSFLMADGAATTVVLDEDYARTQEVELELGRSAVAIDRTRRRLALDDARELAYDALLMATGCRARRIYLPGFPPDDICYLRTRDDGVKLRGRLSAGGMVVIVGGGFIGLEVAATARSLGCDVMVLETAPQLLPRLRSPEASAEVLDHHRRAGIDVRLSSRAISAEGRILTLSDGVRVEANLVIAGVGAEPNIDLARAAGLPTADGVLTDELGRTSDPTIFAAGDVTCQFNSHLGRRVRLESWHNANQQAHTAGRAIVGASAPPIEPPWVWSDQGELNLQLAGEMTDVDHAIVRRDPVERGVTVLGIRGGRLVGGVTVNRGKEMSLIRRLLTDPHTQLDLARLADPAVSLRRAIRSNSNA